MSNVLSFDDPALRSACDVYLSLDGSVYDMVGIALEPCTIRLPFKLPFDEELKGTTAYLKFCAIDEYGRHASFDSAKAHRCKFPDSSELLIVAV